MGEHQLTRSYLWKFVEACLLLEKDGKTCESQHERGLWWFMVCFFLVDSCGFYLVDHLIQDSFSTCIITLAAVCEIYICSITTMKEVCLLEKHGKTHLPNPRVIMFLMRSRTVKTSQHSGQWLMDGYRSVHELPRGNKTVLENERLPRKIIRSKDKRTSKMEWDCQLPLLWWSCCGLPPVVRTP